MNKKGSIKEVYFNYLFAAFGSSLIAAIYSSVDAAMVGRYQGPIGTATLAIIGPIWNIIYSIGLLTGIGGSVLFSNEKGKGNEKTSNEYFTVAVLGTILLSFIATILFISFEESILIFFGADKSILPLAKQYMQPVKFIIPVFLFTQLVSAFLRNDKDPLLATKATLIGGVFNIFGDYYFIFIKDMGIFGAGLATSIGAVLSFLIMLIHFIKKTNSLHFVSIKYIANKFKSICVTGFSTFFIDVAMGIISLFFNKQILRYLSTDALSVYGVIIYTSTFIQCFAYSIGQASQPIISLNYGAKEVKNIKETLNYALKTAAVFGILWTFSAEAFPNVFVRIFMTPTDNILKIAPRIIRIYGMSFILLPFNIFSTYYFQAIMKPKKALVISILRGAVLSGLFIYTLPILFNGNTIWYVMPITETIITIIVIKLMKDSKKELNYL